MSSDNNRYGSRRSGGGHGDVFTSPEIVSYMLDLVGYTADKDLSKTSILEPSCGEGEFVIEIIRRLQESSRRFGFDFEEAFLGYVFAYDIDESKIKSCIERLVSLGFSLSYEDNIRQADFLTISIRSFDITQRSQVGNYLLLKTLSHVQR